MRFGLSENSIRALQPLTRAAQSVPAALASHRYTRLDIEITVPPPPLRLDTFLAAADGADFAVVLRAAAAAQRATHDSAIDATIRLLIFALLEDAAWGAPVSDATGAAYVSAPGGLLELLQGAVSSVATRTTRAAGDVAPDFVEPGLGEVTFTKSNVSLVQPQPVAVSPTVSASLASGFGEVADATLVEAGAFVVSVTVGVASAVGLCCCIAALFLVRRREARRIKRARLARLAIAGISAPVAAARPLVGGGRDQRTRGEVQLSATGSISGGDSSITPPSQSSFQSSAMLAPAPADSLVMARAVIRALHEAKQRQVSSVITAPGTRLRAPLAANRGLVSSNNQRLLVAVPGSVSPAAQLPPASSATGTSLSLLRTPLASARGLRRAAPTSSGSAAAVAQAARAATAARGHDLLDARPSLPPSTSTKTGATATLTSAHASGVGVGPSLRRNSSVSAAAAAVSSRQWGFATRANAAAAATRVDALGEEDVDVGKMSLSSVVPSLSRRGGAQLMPTQSFAAAQLASGSSSTPSGSASARGESAAASKNAPILVRNARAALRSLSAAFSSAGATRGAATASPTRLPATSDTAVSAGALSPTRSVLGSGSRRSSGSGPATSGALASLGGGGSGTAYTPARMPFAAAAHPMRAQPVAASPTRSPSSVRRASSATATAAVAMTAASAPSSARSASRTSGSGSSSGGGRSFASAIAAAAAAAASTPPRPASTGTATSVLSDGSTGRIAKRAAATSSEEEENLRGGRGRGSMSQVSLNPGNARGLSVLPSRPRIIVAEAASTPLTLSATSTPRPLLAPTSTSTAAATGARRSTAAAALVTAVRAAQSQAARIAVASAVSTGDVWHGSTARDAEMRTRSLTAIVRAAADAAVRPGAAFAEGRTGPSVAGTSNICPRAAAPMPSTAIPTRDDAATAAAAAGAPRVLLQPLSSTSAVVGIHQAAKSRTSMASAIAAARAATNAAAAAFAGESRASQSIPSSGSDGAVPRPSRDSAGAETGDDSDSRSVRSGGGASFAVPHTEVSGASSPRSIASTFNMFGAEFDADMEFGRSRTIARASAASGVAAAAAAAAHVRGSSTANPLSTLALVAPSQAAAARVPFAAYPLPPSSSGGSSNRNTIVAAAGSRSAPSSRGSTPAPGPSTTSTLNSGSSPRRAVTNVTGGKTGAGVAGGTASVSRIATALRLSALPPQPHSRADTASITPSTERSVDSSTPTSVVGVSDAAARSNDARLAAGEATAAPTYRPAPSVAQTGRQLAAAPSAKPQAHAPSAARSIAAALQRTGRAVTDSLARVPATLSSPTAAGGTSNSSFNPASALTRTVPPAAERDMMEQQRRGLAAALSVAKRAASVSASASGGGLRAATATAAAPPPSRRLSGISAAAMRSGPSSSSSSGTVATRNAASASPNPTAPRSARISAPPAAVTSNAATAAAAAAAAEVGSQVAVNPLAALAPVTRPSDVHRQTAGRSSTVVTRPSVAASLARALAMRPPAALPNDSHGKSSR